MPDQPLTLPLGPIASALSSTPAGGTPSSPTPPASPTAPSPSAEWRAGPDAAEWARGKTAEQILAVAQGYVDTYARSPQPTAAVAAAPTPEAPIADDMILTGKDLRKALAQGFAQYVQPALTQNATMTSGAIYAQARGLFPTEFTKYEPEIQQVLASVPREQWTIDNLERVVTFVRGRHVADLAREEAQRLVANMDPTIRSGGGSGLAPTPQQPTVNPWENPNVPAEWKQRAQQAGISEATIREFCATNEMAPEDFWKMFDKSPMQPIVAEAGRGR